MCCSRWCRPRRSTCAAWKPCASRSTRLRGTSRCRRRWTAGRRLRLRRADGKRTQRAAKTARTAKSPLVLEALAVLWVLCPKTKRPAVSRRPSCFWGGSTLRAGQGDDRRGPGLPVGRVVLVAQGLEGLDHEDVLAVRDFLDLVVAVVVVAGAVPGEVEEARGRAVARQELLFDRVVEHRVDRLAVGGLADLDVELLDLVVEVDQQEGHVVADQGVAGARGLVDEAGAD